jgi:uncharacterized protein YunC (DUF1805 family)
MVGQTTIDGIPVIDRDNTDITGCNIRLQNSNLMVNIRAEDFQKCGVSQCGNANDLCLRLRFPQIRGMRMLDDPMLTLQCKVQRRVASKTHAIRLGVANNVQGRAYSGAFAQGGSQLPLRTYLGILRKDTNGHGFTRNLEPGGAVTLGEDLVLRSQVRAGDGWNYTKLSDVLMQRLSPSGGILNSAILLRSNGCVNPLMRSICPAAATFEAPLGFRLGFKAAMFEGMKSGDELVLSAKVFACMDRSDCEFVS